MGRCSKLPAWRPIALLVSPWINHNRICCASSKTSKRCSPRPSGNPRGIPYTFTRSCRETLRCKTSLWRRWIPSLFVLTFVSDGPDAKSSHSHFRCSGCHVVLRTCSALAEARTSYVWARLYTEAIEPMPGQDRLAKRRNAGGHLLWLRQSRPAGGPSERLVLARLGLAHAPGFDTWGLFARHLRRSQESLIGEQRISARQSKTESLLCCSPARKISAFENACTVRNVEGLPSEL